MFQILVVEDDNDLRNLFCKTLQRNSYRAFPAEDAENALQILEQEHIDLMITDVMMPGMDGFSLIRRLRETNQELPILIVTAKGDIYDKHTGFQAGTDDYMVKPIDLHELLLRINALLRRARSISEKKLTFGQATLEYATWTMHDAAGIQILPQKEFQLLYKLLSYPRTLFTKRQLIDDIWDLDSDVDEHTVEVYISRLREKFRDNPDFELRTIRGFGYIGMPREDGNGQK